MFWRRSLARDVSPHKRVGANPGDDRQPLRIFVPSAAGLLTDHVPDGEGLIAWNLLCRLAGRGHTLLVCARQAELSDPAPFQVVELPMGGLESVHALGYAWRTRRVFERGGGANEFDVVHWLFPQGRDVLTLLPRRLPSFIGPHSLFWPPIDRRRRLGDGLAALVAPVTHALRRRTAASASCILVSVPAARATYARDADRVAVIPFGVDELLFAPRPLPPNPTVLFAGRLSPEKGVRTLIEAFSIVGDRMPQARLRIAGDGPMRAWVEERASRSPQIEVLGGVPHGRMPDLLGDSSLLCLPSVGEPFGMATLEAMSAGRAVVGVESGGTAVLVEGRVGGRLVAPDSVSELAEALSELLLDRSALESAGAHNRERVVAQYTWDRVIDQIEDVYYAAIAARAAGSTRLQKRRW